MTKATRLSRTDRDAMRRAIEIVRRESFMSREQIDAKLCTEPWEEVGRFAAYAAQCTALKLRPWQAPPCHTRGFTDRPSDSYGNRPTEMKLRDDLLAAGLSLLEPDPEGALAAKMT
jgi:hypothetical protein